MEQEGLTMILNFVKEGGFTAVFIALYVMERRAHMETLGKYIEFMRDSVYRREARYSEDEPPTRSRRPTNFPAKSYQPPDHQEPVIPPEI